MSPTSDGQGGYYFTREYKELLTVAVSTISSFGSTTEFGTQ
jgi:hypothetical protein